MSSVFVARQPIFTKNQQVFAYELLFRCAKEHTTYQAADGNQATARILIDSLLELGFNELTNNRTAFVNFPAELLLAPFVEELPLDMIVIEILETVLPTQSIIDRCKDLKAKGAQLALDDFILTPQYQELAALADYIKIDFRATDPHTRRSLAVKLSRPGLSLIAEKVETFEEYSEAISCGYDLIQGYFFCKPQVVSHKTLHLAEQPVMDFLQELSGETVDFDQLESILRRDLALSYKLLRLINSPYFGLNKEITSIMQALTLMGQKELYKWSSLLLLSSFSSLKTPELLKLSLVRARFAELMAQHLARPDAHEFFLGGMFSLINVFLDHPMNDALSCLPIRQCIKDGISEENNTLGLVLRLATSYEHADWNKSAAYATQLGLPEALAADAYQQAQGWHNWR